MIDTLYDKLGVDKNATDGEIKDAYKDLAKKLHPDKPGGDKDKFQEVAHAYLVLRDPVKRNKYDTTGEEFEQSFDTKFNMFVNNIFMKLVDVEDVDRRDLVFLFKQQCQLQRKQLEKDKKVLASKMAKCHKVLSRLDGDGRIGKVVKMNIDMFKMEIARFDSEIDFMKDSEEVIWHHSYKFDQEPDISSFIAQWQQTRG